MKTFLYTLVTSHCTLTLGGGLATYLPSIALTLSPRPEREPISIRWFVVSMFAEGRFVEVTTEVVRAYGHLLSPYPFHHTLLRPPPPPK